MNVTLDTTASNALVCDLADAVCSKPDGTRWKNVSIVQMTNTCGRFHEERMHSGNSQPTRLRAASPRMAGTRLRGLTASR